jgi:hypothetical protein
MGEKGDDGKDSPSLPNQSQGDVQKAGCLFSFLRNVMAHFTSSFTDGYVHVNRSPPTTPQSTPPQVKGGDACVFKGEGKLE